MERYTRQDFYQEVEQVNAALAKRGIDRAYEASASGEMGARRTHLYVGTQEDVKRGSGVNHIYTGTPHECREAMYHDAFWRGK